MTFIEHGSSVHFIDNGNFGQGIRSGGFLIYNRDNLGISIIRGKNEINNNLSLLFLLDAIDLTKNPEINSASVFQPYNDFKKGFRDSGCHS